MVDSSTLALPSIQPGDPDTQSNTNRLLPPLNPGAMSTSSEQSSTSTALASKSKIFLKSTSPDVPLHIHLPRELSHSLTKKLQITIKAHGGVVEPRLGKAHLIVVDPHLATVSKKLLRDANQMGQPIPVVMPDYILDSAAQAQLLDSLDPKYKYDPPLSHPSPQAQASSTPAPRAPNGRNPFTESDRQAMVFYFVDKPESSWSLNAAARELAVRHPTHTHQSFQTYLQSNFDTGWNLKQQVLVARRKALEDAPSELQARILRSQYTAPPGLHEQSEQSAPSDGWPCASPEPQSEPQEETQPSIPSQNDLYPQPVQQASSQPDDDDQDLLIRQPNPGTSLNSVDKNPTSLFRGFESPLSEESDPLTEPPLSNLLTQSRASPSVDEESDPQQYSPTILDRIQRATSLRPSASQKLNQDRRRNSESSSYSDSPHQRSERHEPPSQPAKKTQTLYDQASKDMLINALVDLVFEKGRNLSRSAQNRILNRPTSKFWEDLSAAHPNHTSQGWRKHFERNRPLYKRIASIMITERQQGDDSGQEDGTSHVESEDELATGSQSREQPNAANEPTSLPSDTVAIEKAADQHSSNQPSGQQDPESQQEPETASQSRERPDAANEPTSAPSDAVAIEKAADQHPRDQRSVAERSTPEHQPVTLPPPMEDRDEVENSIQDANLLAEPSPSDRGQIEVPLLPPSIAGNAGVKDLELSKADSNHGQSVYPTSSSAKLLPLSASLKGHLVAPRSNDVVEAGTPVLAQHRDAPFYDFTMDSDEEQHALKARSRPSLPNMQSHQQTVPPKLQQPLISSDRVLGHFATPSRNQRPAATRHASLSLHPGLHPGQDDELALSEKTTSNLSAASFSALRGRWPTAEPFVVTQSSSSSASRLDRAPMLSTNHATEVTTSHLQDGQPSRQLSSLSPLPEATATSLAPALSRTNRSNPQFEAARLRYRADAETFRKDFDLNRQQCKDLLVRFNGNIKVARNFIDNWMDSMQDTYDVGAALALEYLKTSRGDFEQAENFLRLANTTRFSSTPSRSAELSRSHPASISPQKRRSGNNDYSPTRAYDLKRRRESLKRVRG